MIRLGNQTSAVYRFSGLVTESDGCSIEAMRPYVEHMLQDFVPER